jgi:hypothetical protein
MMDWELEKAYDEAKWCNECLEEAFEKKLITLKEADNLKFVLAEAIEKMLSKGDPLILTANINYLLGYLQDHVLKSKR